MKRLFFWLALLISTLTAVDAMADCNVIPSTDHKPFRYRLSNFNPPAFNPNVADGTLLYSGTHDFIPENSGPTGWTCDLRLVNYGGRGSLGPHDTLSTPLKGIGLRMRYAFDPRWWPYSESSAAVGLSEGYTVQLVVELVKVGPITAGGTLNGVVAAKWIHDGTVKAAEYLIDNAPIRPLVPTCSLQNNHIPVSLDKVDISRFKGIGSASDDQPFHVRLSCAGGSAGTETNIHATLTDANDLANRGDTLKLSPGSTAKGVGIQIRKDGTVLKYGADSRDPANPNQWPAGLAANGPFDIALTARYIQTEAEVGAGTANGRATITMSYQ
ncbi:MULTISPECIES: fimbrial protein [Cupriavidus]